jgi:hypothetical protein
VRLGAAVQTRLSVAGTGVRDLAPLQRSRKLRVIDIGGTRITDEELGGLPAALPDIEVIGTSPLADRPAR